MIREPYEVQSYAKGFSDAVKAMEEIINERMEVLQGIIDYSQSQLLREDATITQHAIKVIKEELCVKLKGGGA